MQSHVEELGKEVGLSAARLSSQLGAKKGNLKKVMATRKGKNAL